MIRALTFALTLISGLAVSVPGLSAEAIAYRLIASETTAAFRFSILGLSRRGTMAVRRADLAIDLENISQSRVKVVLDSASISTGLSRLDEELREDDMLDTARYPEVTFQATAISGTLNNAVMTGNLTIKGTTHPVTLRGGVYRPRGAASDATDQLIIRAEGNLDRRDLGLDGYLDIVPPTIRLEIETLITR